MTGCAGPAAQIVNTGGATTGADILGHARTGSVGAYDGSWLVAAAGASVSVASAQTVDWLDVAATGSLTLASQVVLTVQRGEHRRKPGTPAYEEHQKRLRESEEKARRIRSEREADLFGLDGNQPDVTDFYEDEVFNVNNLPKANEYPFDEPRDTEEQ